MVKDKQGYDEFIYIYIVLFTSVKPLPGLLAPPPE